MVTALKAMGFDKVFDTDWGADLTIMEEGTELLGRIKAALGDDEEAKKAAPLPMITSCSPGWIKHCEHAWADELAHLSSCKSPHMMQGAMIKSYYAEKMGIDPAKIFVVSIMPCTAKKYEVSREEQRLANGSMPVDVALTTRELGRMIDQAGIMFTQLPDEEFDPMFGVSTGASVIFGATGGVMEAALRTVVEVVTGDEAAPVEFKNVRGFKGV